MARKTPNLRIEPANHVGLTDSGTAYDWNDHSPVRQVVRKKGSQEIVLVADVAGGGFAADHSPLESHRLVDGKQHSFVRRFGIRLDARSDVFLSRPVAKQV